MKNLYKALGHRSIVQDEGTLRESMERFGLDPSIAQASKFVLLDPGRRECYDETLRSAIFLAEIRRRLGMPMDPNFPAVESSGFDPGVRKRPKEPLLLASGALLGLVVLAVVGTLAARNCRTPLVPDAAGPSTVTGGSNSGTVATGASPEKTSIPQAAPSPRPDPTRPVPGLDPQLPPPHGWAQVTTTLEPRVNWTVETEAGQMYLVTLKDFQTQKVLVRAFIHGGQPFNLSIPEGDYELSYTTGFYWYGLHQRFGPGTATLRFIRPFLVHPLGPGPSEWSLRLQSALGQPVGTTDVSRGDQDD